MCPVLSPTDALGDSQCPWEWLEVPVAFHGAWAHQDMMVRPGRAIMKLTFKPTPHHPIPGFSAFTAPSQELGNCVSQVIFTPMRWCHVWVKAILCRRLLEPSHETCEPYMSLQEVSMCTQYACTGDVQIHLNFCIPHTHCQLLYGFTYTVEPLYIGHHWDPAGCPVKRGVPNSELDLYTALCHWECGHFSLERCSSFRLPFIERFHCTTTHTLSATLQM